MTQRLQWVLPPSFDDCLLLDVEASGLHAASYPIEIGWCGLDLLAASFLVKPPAHWSEDDWSIVSERVHGISRQMAIAEGIDVPEAAARLNAACAGKRVASDRPRFDQAWLSRLFEAARIDQSFVLEDKAQFDQTAARFSGLDTSEMEAVQERVGRRYPHLHRAATDARRAAAMLAAVVMPDELEAILAVA